MALFGEKYPDIVRVVQMGDFSRELCGGTHLDSVGQVGLFKIVGEESVAAGTRRITALTGKAALDYVRQEEEILADLAATLRVPPGQVGQRVARAARGDQDPEEAGEPAAARGRRRASRPTTCSPRPRRSAGSDRRGPGRRRRSRPTRCGSSIDVLRRKRPETAGGPPGLDGRRQGPARRRAVAGPGRRRAARGQLAQGGRARSSAAAAADGPTWPRPAARSPTRSRPLWPGPSRSSAPGS